MKYVLVLLIFLLHLLCSLSTAKERTTIEIVHDPFAVFYPHLGNSMCRKKAFEIGFDKKISKGEKVELWKKYKKTCSADGSYQLILADIYLSHGYSNISREILEQHIQNSKNYDTRYHKSLLHTTYQCLGEEYKAIDLAKKMIADYKNWYGGYKALGTDYVNIGDWSNAKKYLEKSLKLYDKDPVIYLSLAVVAYELKEDDQVLDYYWKAFLLDPLKPYLNWRSSAAAIAVYVLRGQFAEAKEILDHQQEYMPEIAKDKRFIAVKKYYTNALKKANKHE